MHTIFRVFSFVLHISQIAQTRSHLTTTFLRVRGMDKCTVRYSGRSYTIYSPWGCSELVRLTTGVSGELPLHTPTRILCLDKDTDFGPMCQRIYDTNPPVPQGSCSFSRPLLCFSDTPAIETSDSITSSSKIFWSNQHSKCLPYLSKWNNKARIHAGERRHGGMIQKFRSQVHAWIVLCRL